MKISNSTKEDIDIIFKSYQEATAYMRSLKTVTVWPPFDRAMVLKEISENRQWKITIDHEIACVWATTFSDPEIWEAKNADPAIYIHRIATNPKFKGLGMVSKIVSWAKDYAAAQDKEFIRMDTAGNNTSLIRHYTKSGFDFIGYHQMKSAVNLPAHYQGAILSLFEIKL